MKTPGSKLKRLVFAAALMLVQISPAAAYSQDKQNTSQKPQQQNKALTAEQTATVKKILSKYNPKTLTTAEAQAIHEQFRQAGIHAGPETKDAITAAGFDPEKLKALAPPRQPDNSGKTNPQAPEDKMKLLKEKVIVPLGLNASQAQTVTQAYTDFYSSMDALKKAQGSSQGPLDKSKVEPLEKARDEKVKAALTKEQFAKYPELEKSLRQAKH